MSSIKIENFAEAIDELACLDIGNRNIAPLYSTYRAISKTPLCLQAAKKLAELPTNSNVLIATGFTILPNQTGETDGPSGAAVLANALSKGLNINSIVLTDPHLVNIAQAPLKIFGIKVPVVVFPFKKPEEFAEEILAKNQPSALIAIERPGWNIKRIHHNMKGINI